MSPKNYIYRPRFSKEQLQMFSPNGVGCIREDTRKVSYPDGRTDMQTVDVNFAFLYVGNIPAQLVSKLRAETSIVDDVTHTCYSRRVVAAI